MGVAVQRLRRPGRGSQDRGQPLVGVPEEGGVGRFQIAPALDPVEQAGDLDQRRGQNGGLAGKIAQRPMQRLQGLRSAAQRPPASTSSTNSSIR
jgi:hypothetical protein